MSEVVTLLVSWGLSLALLFKLLAWDERRLSPERNARAWPPATRSLALVYFGVVALPVHFARTRRTLLGFLEGVAWGVAIGVVEEGVGDALELLLRRLHID